MIKVMSDKEGGGRVPLVRENQRLYSSYFDILSVGNVLVFSSPHPLPYTYTNTVYGVLDYQHYLLIP